MQQMTLNFPSLELVHVARIRTIKPEFPQSESMGRVSREARLLFILLWTFVDDSGRARGHSRVLASHLYPFDTDAADLVDGWIAELERENCVMRYEVGGTTYIQVVNWSHQKIDKPSVSRLPPFSDNAKRVLPQSREPFENVRETSREVPTSSRPYLVPSTLDLVPSTVVPSATQTAKPSPVTPLDFKKMVFSTGVTFLTGNSGLSERDARTMLGKWRKDFGDAEIMSAMATAEGAAVSDPIPYIQRILHGKAKQNGQQQAEPHPLGQFGILLEKYGRQDADEISGGS